MNDGAAENSSTDLADLFFVVCVIVRTRFIGKIFFEKTMGKVGGFDGLLSQVIKRGLPTA